MSLIDHVVTAYKIQVLNSHDQQGNTTKGSVAHGSGDQSSVFINTFKRYTFLLYLSWN